MEPTAPAGTVLGVCIGRVRPLEAGGRIHRTAFVKVPATEPVTLSVLGLEGDEHQYPAHGGPDQALLVYSADHYPRWAEEFGLDLPEAGAFGENLTVVGLTEEEVCIGDTFALGDEVVVQVTSPRSPCYKIGLRYDRRQLPLRMQETSRPGYLMRVLVEGELRTGDRMRLIERPSSALSVAEAARVVNRDRDDWPVVERLAAMPELAEAMRQTLTARLTSRDRDGDEHRLFGQGEGEPVA